jgi:hypothetical protein
MADVFDEIFERYVQDLRPARDEAVRWWQSLLDSTAADPDATQRLRLRWPCGPTSHPRVIGVYRQYYLECDKVNVEIWKKQANRNATAGWGEDDEKVGTGQVPPARFLLDNLESVDAELGKFMEILVFSPIGTNVNDEAS